MNNDASYPFYCPNCDINFDVNFSHFNVVLFCPFCSNDELIENNDVVVIEPSTTEKRVLYSMLKKIGNSVE